MSLSIKQKLFFLLSGLTIVVLVLVLYAVNSTASSTIRENVISNFRQTQGFFDIELNLRYDRLIESAYLIQENSTFKANIELNDPPTARQVVEQFAAFLKVDLLAVTNDEGNVLSWLDRPDKTGIDLSEDRATVEAALNFEEPPFRIEWPELWAVDDQLYQVVTVPIFTQNAIIGTITLGTLLSDDTARELAQNTNMDVTFFLGDSPIASTQDLFPAPVRQQFFDTYQPMIDSVLTNLVITDPFMLSVTETDRFSFISPLGKGEPAFYIATIPTEQQFAILSDVQKSLIIIAILAIVLIIPVAIIMGRLLSRRLNQLTQAMAEVEKGHFDVKVQTSSDDEIGQMTSSFNTMVDELRQRFALQKYVGSHTIEMIKKSPGESVKLGGSNKEMAIIFSDIRSSTKIIESSEPKVFVENLNKMLSFQSAIVADYDGSIDKFVGDAMIALFEGDRALERAIQCAVDITQTLKTQSDITDFFWDGIGIGINYGSMLLGNMGGENRMDYTVIGPEVNLCARLCDAARSGEILLPSYLLDTIPIAPSWSATPLDAMHLKGFSKEIKISNIHHA